MKAKLATAVCVLTISLNGATYASEYDNNGTLNVAADAVVVRPACLVATVLGSAIFVVVLPVSAISKSVKTTAHALVARPAKATFTRPMGDMDALLDD